MPAKPAAPKRKELTVLNYLGVRHTVKQWARLTGLRVPEILARVMDGWPVKKALTADAPFPIQYNKLRGKPVSMVVEKPKTKRPYTPVPKLTYDGVTRTLPTWSKMTGIPVRTLKSRIKDHWSAEDTLDLNPTIGRSGGFVVAPSVSKRLKRLTNGEMLVRARQTLHQDVIEELRKHVGTKQSLSHIIPQKYVSTKKKGRKGHK